MKKYPKSPKHLINSLKFENVDKTNEFLNPEHKPGAIATLMDMGDIATSGAEEKSFLSGWQNKDNSTMMKMHMSDDNDKSKTFQSKSRRSPNPFKKKGSVKAKVMTRPRINIGKLNNPSRGEPI